MEEVVTAKKPRMSKWKKLILIKLVILAVALVLWQVPSIELGLFGQGAVAYETKYEKDVHVRFGMEVYDTIVDKYWQVVDETELAELFRLSLSKARGDVPATLPTLDRVGVAEMLASALEQVEEGKRKGLVVDTSIIALANLAPQGRSGLLSEKEETAFRDNVNNVKRDRDLYASLGLATGATKAEVEEAIKGKEDDEEAQYAYSVLADDNTKAIYDQTKIEPSLTAKDLGSGTLYLDLRQITSATFQEAAVKLDSISASSTPEGIIIDLRGNVGGALDFARYFFALFAGPNQYAHDLWSQGELEVWRTPAVPKITVLDEVEDVAILTDSDSQSTSELITAIFKKFGKASVVGATTKGWGTVENTFPLETHFDDGEKYLVLLVHSLTLREDGEAIEGRGVDPDVDIGDMAWKTKLTKYFKSRKFIADIVEVVEE